MWHKHRLKVPICSIGKAVKTREANRVADYIAQDAVMAYFTKKLPPLALRGNQFSNLPQKEIEFAH